MIRRKYSLCFRPLSRKLIENMHFRAQRLRGPTSGDSK
jgi:hypothetical protein